MKLWGVIAVVLGLYSLFEWGVLGRSPWEVIGQTAHAATGGTVALPGTSAASGGGGAPNSGIFGLQKGLSVIDALTSSIGSFIQGPDSAGLQQYGGGAASNDWNYPTPLGTGVKLPGDAHVGYTFLGYDNGPWGNAMVFRTPGGGTMEFMHLGQTASALAGQVFHGGDTVAKSGTAAAPWVQPSYSPILSVIVDSKAANWLKSL